MGKRGVPLKIKSKTKFKGQSAGKVQVVMQKIQVVSVRGLAANKAGVVYVGRQCAGWQGSVLGNPFKGGSRSSNIQQYKSWLWAQYQVSGPVQQAVNGLVARYVAGQALVLGCWCAPLPCHANVVANLVVYLAKKG